uniref:DUF4795 domain-containing protein n=1 Tax=Sarcophilus harrisii TaxID=9305 RepID=A0A7N4P842_SARHA
MDLDPVKKQMEHMWKFIKKSLMEGPRFDAETAAGFRKQLFDRMKCISCDRPVNVMTSPQLISVRNLDISHHARPVSANSYEYLKQLKLREMQQLQSMTNAPERGDMPTDGQARLDNNSSLRRIVKMPNLTTIHPYGDPSVFPPPNSEVNILGVDGNLYKGRMGLRGTPRSFMTEKDLAGLKVPKPPPSRKVPEYSSISNVLYPASSPRTSLTAQVLQQFSQPMMPSGILQHSPSSANLSPKIPSTNNRPTTKATTSGGPFTRKFGKSSKSRSASLPTGGLNPNSREEGTNIQDPIPSYKV